MAVKPGKVDPDAAPRCWCGGRLSLDRFDVATPEDGPYRVAQCDRCSVHALLPQPDDAALARAYAGAYYGSDRRKFVGPVARVIGWFQGQRARRVRSLVPAGGRVLDVGCGNGAFAIALAEAGYTIDATELSAQSAARVPAHSRVTVHVGDLMTLDLPEQTFDAITIWHVLEHVRDPHATLARAAALLKPGGLLLMEVPNHASWQARAFKADWLHLDPPRHLFGFTPQSLATLCVQTGFRVERISTLSLEQGPFGVVQSILNRFGLPRDRAYEQLKGTARTSALIKAMDIAMLAILTPIGVAASLLETAFGCGAVVNICAQKTPTAET